jgi:Fe-S-cluster-containing hydrogenase component 2
MDEYAHGFTVDASRCNGCLACMRVCPTQAIRVRDGRAAVRQELCIDCGSCLTACSRGVFAPTTRTLEDFADYAFRVAIPSPVLYGQFPLDVKPQHIAQGLLAVGFDAVWDYGVDTRLVAQAIVDYVDGWEGPRPLISIACACVVRLMQVSYPRMLDQAIRVSPPREVAGREVKRRYAQELGLAPERIAAIYITPCEARTVSILRPAEGGSSSLDGAIGIPQLYNRVLDAARAAACEAPRDDAQEPVRSSIMLRWSTRRPLADLLEHRRYLAVTGLPNIIQVFDDIEKGKLRDIDFLEANACWGGCCNGNLTVDNVYVSQAKLQMLMAGLPDTDPETEAEVARRYPEGDFGIQRPFLPRERVVVGDLRERVRRLKEAGEIAAVLPGYDCGLCGAPSCATLAHDVAAGEAARGDCVFLGRDRLDQLRGESHGRRRGGR